MNADAKRFIISVAMISMLSLAACDWEQSFWFSILSDSLSTRFLLFSVHDKNTTISMTNMILSNTVFILLVFRFSISQI